MGDRDGGAAVGGPLWRGFIHVFRGLRRIAHVWDRPVIILYILLKGLYQRQDIGCNGAGELPLSASSHEC